MSMTCFQRSFACGTATDVLLSHMLETWRGQSRGREKSVTPAYSLFLPFFFPPFFPPPFSVSLPPLATTRLASCCDVALPQVHTFGASPFLWSGRTAIFDHPPQTICTFHAAAFIMSLISYGFWFYMLASYLLPLLF